MMNRHHIPFLLLALIGAVAFITSCRTTDTVTSTALESEASTPRIVTVLQSDGCGNTASTVALIKAYAAECKLDIQIERVIVQTYADVQKHRFLGSPTVRINGLDVDPSARSRTQYGFA